MAAIETWDNDTRAGGMPIEPLGNGFYGNLELFNHGLTRIENILGQFCDY